MEENFTSYKIYTIMFININQYIVCTGEMSFFRSKITSLRIQENTHNFFKTIIFYCNYYFHEFKMFS